MNSEEIKKTLIERNNNAVNRGYIPAFQQLRRSKIEEGSYTAVITDIVYAANVNTKNGIADRVQLVLDVAISHPLDDSIRIEKNVETFYISGGFNYRYKQRFEALLGFDPHEGFDPNKLIGQAVYVEIKHNTDAKGNVYENLSYVALKEDEVE